MAEITQINIRIGEKDIPLSLNEAKELMHILQDLFGENKPATVVPIPYPVEVPRRWRYWDYPGTWVVTNDNTLFYSNSSSTLTLTANSNQE